MVWCFGAVPVRKWLKMIRGAAARSYAALLGSDGPDRETTNEVSQDAENALQFADRAADLLKLALKHQPRPRVAFSPTPFRTRR